MSLKKSFLNSRKTRFLFLIGVFLLCAIVVPLVYAFTLGHERRQMRQHLDDIIEHPMTMSYRVQDLEIVTENGIQIYEIWSEVGKATLDKVDYWLIEVQTKCPSTAVLALNEFGEELHWQWDYRSLYIQEQGYFYFLLNVPHAFPNPLFGHNIMTNKYVLRIIPAEPCLQVKKVLVNRVEDHSNFMLFRLDVIKVEDDGYLNSLRKNGYRSGVRR